MNKVKSIWEQIKKGEISPSDFFSASGYSAITVMVCWFLSIVWAGLHLIDFDDTLTDMLTGGLFYLLVTCGAVALLLATLLALLGGIAWAIQDQPKRPANNPRS